MKKLMLASISYNIRDIEGLVFLIPSRLRRFERPVENNLRKVVALLKEKGWREYILMADFPTVVVSSPPKGNFGLLFGREIDRCRRVFFVDSGLMAKQPVAWIASALVHEATHVFQQNYFSHEEMENRKKKEVDACGEQLRFLGRLGGVRWYMREIRRMLKKSRGWWEYLDNGPTTKQERYWAKRRLLCERIHDDLTPHISF